MSSTASLAVIGIMITLCMLAIIFIFILLFTDLIPIFKKSTNEQESIQNNIKVSDSGDKLIIKPLNEEGEPLIIEKNIEGNMDIKLNLPLLNYGPVLTNNEQTTEQTTEETNEDTTEQTVVVPSSGELLENFGSSIFN